MQIRKDDPAAPHVAALLAHHLAELRGHMAEFDRWEWKDMASLPDLIVPFKRSVYLQVMEAFGHLAGR